MSDFPILFSAPMVRAILREIEQPGTGKTQTRRVISPQPSPELIEAAVHAGGLTFRPAALFGSDTHKTLQRLRRPDDRLYVREAWRSDTRNDGVKPSEIARTEPIWFAADGAGINLTDWSLKSSKGRPGMFLPRWASRITLIVADVRVERLQEISGADAIAEGVEGDPVNAWRCYLPEPKNQTHWLDPRESFRTLWDSLNGDRPGCAWRYDPWIAAYSFRPILGNVDQIEKEAA